MNKLLTIILAAGLIAPMSGYASWGGHPSGVDPEAKKSGSVKIVESELQPVEGVADVDWDRLNDIPMRDLSAGLQVLFYTYFSDCGTGKAAKASKHILTAQLLASFLPENSIRASEGTHMLTASVEGVAAMVNVVNAFSSLKKENKWDGLCDGILSAMLAYHSARNLYEGAKSADPDVDGIAEAIDHYKKQIQ